MIVHEEKPVGVPTDAPQKMVHLGCGTCVEVTCCGAVASQLTPDEVETECVVCAEFESRSWACPKCGRGW